MDEQRVIGIDFGHKNIGLAISVPGICISEPLKTVPRETIWAELKQVMKEYNISKIVVGLPLRTDGSEDKITTSARRFAQEVQEKFRIPVELWDERFSTHSAEEILRTNKQRMKMGRLKPPLQHHRKKKPIDHFAAALILEDYLEFSTAD